MGDGKTLEAHGFAIGKAVQRCSRERRLDRIERTIARNRREKNLEQSVLSHVTRCRACTFTRRIFAQSLITHRTLPFGCRTLLVTYRTLPVTGRTLLVAH